MADLETIATGMCGALSRQFSWDGGMNTALLTFESSDIDAVVAAIQPHLPTQWTSDTVKGAPDAVSELIDGLGGLRPGQWIMHSEVGGGPFLVAIFWPWGGGSPISLRVGVVGGDDSADASLKVWLKID